MPARCENPHTDREWLLPMAAIAAAQFGLWWTLWAGGFAKQPMLQAYSTISLIGLGLAFVPFVLWYVFQIHRAGEWQPLKRIRNDIRLPRIAAILAAMVLAPITASAFTAAKSALPFAVPFYLDGALASFERALFGVDPWRISHALLGWATPAIDRLYLTWLPVMLVAFNLVLLSKPSELKTRSLIAYLLMWPAVGTLGSYLFSSAGPIFYNAIYKDGFANLIPTLQREGATGTLLAYEHLWHAYSSQDVALGGGISAMPSMHIAMAFWLALTVRASFPKVQWAGWAYFALIWVGSVHLGWHYAVDGLAGTLGAALVWRAAPWLAFGGNARGSVETPGLVEPAQ